MKKTNQKTKGHILEVLCYISLTLVLCFLFQELTIPKYMSHPYEGAMMAEYYQTETKHDVIFLGDCEFYETISPVTLWEEYGISSYVRGSPQQLIWQSYYVLLDTLKHETPKVVVFNAMEMKIGKVQSEAYTRLTLDGLRDINYRLDAAKLSLKEENESLLSYVFPLLRYHSRITDLNEDDFNYFFQRDLISYNGYLMQTTVDPQTEEAFQPPLFDYSFPDICWEYLDKIADLCKENNIQLILFKAPTISWQYPWYTEWDEQLVAYAQEKGLLYINGISYADDMGLDMTTDTYDKGVHLNVYGAEKCSRFLGNILRNDYSVCDGRSDAAQVEAWKPICERYHTARGNE